MAFFFFLCHTNARPNWLMNKKHKHNNINEFLNLAHTLAQISRVDFQLLKSQCCVIAKILLQFADPIMK